MTKLVGYRNITTKKGKEFTLASVVSDFSAREVNNGAVGQKVEDLWLPEDCTNMFKPTDIGKELKLDYELSSGRAYLVGVTVK